MRSSAPPVGGSLAGRPRDLRIILPFVNIGPPEVAKIQHVLVRKIIASR